MTFLLCLELFKEGNIFLAGKTENLSERYFFVKVKILWEGHTIWKISPLFRRLNNKTSERVFFSISYSLFRKPELEMGENHNSNNKSPVLFLLICPIWMVLGVLCNVVISKDCSGSFVGCGKIFDFGILWTICLEISFLMIITSEPINVMYMHMAARILSFLKEL